MKSLTLAACLCVAALSPFAIAQDHADHGAHAQKAEVKPVNSMCPVGKEPIVPSAGTVEYKGKAVGLCCPGCGPQFLAWDEARKDEFLVQAASHKEPGMEHVAGDPAPAEVVEAVEAWSDPYPLDTCLISGQKLRSMGDPIIKKYDGREVRFCCGGCIDDFEADLAASWKKVDQAIIKDQTRYYTMQTCIVSGEALSENGRDFANNMVYGNRLVRLCCTMCEKEFKANPKKFIAKLDKATADAQRKDYPLDTCVVLGGKLGSMGEPTEMVVGGRLLRFCCAGCEPKVKADPAEYIGLIDAAWKARGKFAPIAEIDDGHDEADGHNDDHSGHGDHD